MTRSAVLLAIVTWLTPADILRSAPIPKTAHVDHYGKPLPEGAVARLGSQWLRHRGWTLGADFSPDGRILATVGEEGGAVSLWDTASGKEIQGFRSPSLEPLGIVKYAPSGRILAGTALDDKQSLFLWNTATGKLLHQLQGKRKAAVVALAFSADSKTLISVDAEALVGWWNVGDGKKIREWNAQMVVKPLNKPGSWKLQGLNGAALTADGRKLVGIVQWVQNADTTIDKCEHTLTSWDLELRKQCWQIRPAENDFFEFVDQSADGKVVAVGVSRDAISLRDGNTGREQRRLKPEVVRFVVLDHLALSSDGKLLAAMSDHAAGVGVWSTIDGKLRKYLARNVRGSRHSPPRRPVFSRDGKRLLFPWDDKLTLWDTASWTERPRLQGHRLPVYFLAFSEDGKSLVSTDERNWASITWDTKTWREIARSESLLRQGLLSRDHRLEIVHKEDDCLSLVEHPSGKHLRKLAMSSRDIRGSFSPSGLTVVLAIDGKENKGEEIVLVDVQTGKKRGSLSNKLFRFYWAPALKDRVVAWVDEDDVIHVTAVEGGKELSRLGKPRANGDFGDSLSSLTFSPDGRYLALWERKTNDIVIWNWQEGEELHRLEGDKSTGRSARVGDHPSPVLAFSPDGRCLAIAGKDGSNDVELWEVASWQRRRYLFGHDKPVAALAFSPDGRLLASGSHDTTILVWSLNRCEKVERKQPNALWADLAQPDASTADEAITALAQQPSAAVTLFVQKLQPIAVVEPATIARWIDELDSDHFTEREKAMRSLRSLEERAEPALRKALKAKKSLEAQRRIKQLLGRLKRLRPEQLRLVRAVEALEQIQTPEAEKLLRALAKGAENARLTQEAKSALRRLGKTRR